MKVALSNLLNRRDRSRIAFDIEEELQFHVVPHPERPADAVAIGP